MKTSKMCALVMFLETATCERELKNIHQRLRLWDYCGQIVFAQYGTVNGSVESLAIVLVIDPKEIGGLEHRYLLKVDTEWTFARVHDEIFIAARKLAKRSNPRLWRNIIASIRHHRSRKAGR